MADMNRFMATGNLTADPSFREVERADGNKTWLATGSIAINRAEGQATTFLDYTVWGWRAEAMMGEVARGLFVRGRKVILSGELVLDSWTQEDPETKKVIKRSKHKINVWSIGPEIGSINPRAQAGSKASAPMSAAEAAAKLADIQGSTSTTDRGDAPKSMFEDPSDIEVLNMDEEISEGEMEEEPI